MAMTPRERHVETLCFGSPDRIPFIPGGGRESTLRAWHQQGLPPNRDPMNVVREAVRAERARRGLPAVSLTHEKEWVSLGVSFQMRPTFEEKVLEHRDGHYIVQDWMGAVTEISDVYDYTYIRTARDFVTRKWHRFPVASWEDWERMKGRFDPHDPRRWPDDFDERCRVLRERDYVLPISFNGPFWQLREFCGMEGLCMMMLEQPDLVREMAGCWQCFTVAVLERIVEKVLPDMVHVSEDMAYKEHPMIGPDMTREFCGPAYRAWGALCRDAGIPIFGIDSDGRIDELVPVYLENGVNYVDPMEVAAGNDINAFRGRFGRRLAYGGGIDKRAIAAGGEVLKAELARVRPVIEDGGYVPGCDHGVPPDISWPNFQDYALQLAELTGWLR